LKIRFREGRTECRGEKSDGLIYDERSSRDELRLGFG
jgi:hypothetical protein